MEDQSKMSGTIRQLEYIYKKLNEKFYDNKLSDVIIVIDSTTKPYCVYTKHGVWSSRDGGKYEIRLGAGVLKRSISDVCAYIAHCMAHHYNNTILHKKDCSGHNDIYHNKVFKKAAESHGLVVAHGRYGWAYTKPSDEMHEFSESLDGGEIYLLRGSQQSVSLSGDGKIMFGRYRNSSTRKLICPVCNNSIRATKTGINVLCGDCLVRMEEDVYDEPECEEDGDIKSLCDTKSRTLDEKSKVLLRSIEKQVDAFNEIQEKRSEIATQLQAYADSIKSLTSGIATGISVDTNTLRKLVD